MYLPVPTSYVALQFAAVDTDCLRTVQLFSLSRRSSASGAVRVED